MMPPLNFNPMKLKLIKSKDKGNFILINAADEKIFAVINGSLHKPTTVAAAMVVLRTEDKITEGNRGVILCGFDGALDVADVDDNDIQVVTKRASVEGNMSVTCEC
jgi:hypothetical protein